MSTLLKFQYGVHTVDFEDGSSYPSSSQTQIFQVTDRTAAGTLQVENLGIKIMSRDLVFTLMSKTDYLALVNFYLNVVNGAEKKFTYTDEYGNEYIARIVSDILDFAETSYQRYSGVVSLELDA